MRYSLVRMAARMHVVTLNTYACSQGIMHELAPNLEALRKLAKTPYKYENFGRCHQRSCCGMRPRLVRMNVIGQRFTS